MSNILIVNLWQGSPLRTGPQEAGKALVRARMDGFQAIEAIHGCRSTGGILRLLGCNYLAACP